MKLKPQVLVFPLEKEKTAGKKGKDFSNSNEPYLGSF